MIGWREQRLNGQAGTQSEIVGERIGLRKKNSGSHAPRTVASRSRGCGRSPVPRRPLVDGAAEPGGQQPLAFKRQRFPDLGKFAPDFHFAPWRRAAFL